MNKKENKKIFFSLIRIFFYYGISIKAIDFLLKANGIFINTKLIIFIVLIASILNEVFNTNFEDKINNPIFRMGLYILTFFIMVKIF